MCHHCSDAGRTCPPQCAHRGTKRWQHIENPPPWRRILPLSGDRRRSSDCEHFQRLYVRQGGKRPSHVERHSGPRRSDARCERAEPPPLQRFSDPQRCEPPMEHPQGKPQPAPYGPPQQIPCDAAIGIGEIACGRHLHHNQERTGDFGEFRKQDNEVIDCEC